MDLARPAAAGFPLRALVRAVLLATALLALLLVIVVVDLAINSPPSSSPSSSSPNLQTLSTSPSSPSSTPAVRSIIKSATRVPLNHQVTSHQAHIIDHVRSHTHSRHILFSTMLMNTEETANMMGEMEGWNRWESWRQFMRLRVMNLWSWVTGRPHYFQARLLNSNPQIWLLQVQPTLTPSQRQDIETILGQSLDQYQYLPYHSYAIVATAATAQRLLASINDKNSGVVWVGEYPREAKLTVDLVQYLNQLPTDANNGSDSSSPPVSISTQQQKALAADTQQAPNTPLKLLVQLPKITTFSSMSTATLQQPWEAQFEANQWPVRLTSVNSHRFSITTNDQSQLSSQQIRDLVHWLLSQEETLHIERVIPPRLFNEYATWITQSGQVNNRPIWSKGITGTGVLVGCADSGLDYDNCLFRDTSTPNYGPTNRKVVDYKILPGNDGVDEPNGHGTHVVGSIAGNANG